MCMERFVLVTQQHTWQQHAGCVSPVEVGDELVLLVRHTRPEMCHAQVRLLAVAQVTLQSGG
jgi:hypothetical protein